MLHEYYVIISVAVFIICCALFVVDLVSYLPPESESLEEDELEDYEQEIA